VRLKRDPDTVLRPRQWANDWIMADGVRRPLSPLAVVLDPEDVPRFEADREAFRAGNPNSGRFWADYRLRDDGTFELTGAGQSRVRSLEHLSRVLRFNARRQGR